MILVNGFLTSGDDPEQESPFWVGTNNLVLKTPFPGIQIKAASLVNRNYMQAFLSGTRRENLEAIQKFISGIGGIFSTTCLKAQL
jgi:hypothetical protein